MLLKLLSISLVVAITACAGPQIPPQPNPESFKVRVILEGTCDFGGSIHVLQNRDPANAYRVVVREEYEMGTQHGYHDLNPKLVGKNGKVVIGCSNSQHVPLTKWTRYVVGETVVR